MHDPNGDEIVQYLVFREDLKLPKGKVAAQAGHAAILAVRRVEQEGTPEAGRWLRDWEGGSYVKIALRVADLGALESLAVRLHAAGILYVTVADEGRSVVAPGTITAIGLAPTPRSVVSEIVAGMRLL